MAAAEEVKFLKGVAVSVYQNSGDDDSNWTRFVKQRNIFCLKTVRGEYNIGPSTVCDFWNR